jgi:hypothetical protein
MCCNDDTPHTTDEGRIGRLFMALLNTASTNRNRQTIARGLKRAIIEAGYDRDEVDLRLEMLLSEMQI